MKFFEIEGEATGGSNVHNKFKFEGNEVGEDLGLMQQDFGARQYDYQIGRFTGVDPLADKDGQSSLTPYHFCANDPANATDPTGLYGLRINKNGTYEFSDDVEGGWIISYGGSFFAGGDDGDDGGGNGIEGNQGGGGATFFDNLPLSDFYLTGIELGMDAWETITDATPDVTNGGDNVTPNDASTSNQEMVLSSGQNVDGTKIDWPNYISSGATTLGYASIVLYSSYSDGSVVNGYQNGMNICMTFNGMPEYQNYNVIQVVNSSDEGVFYDCLQSSYPFYNTVNNYNQPEGQDNQLTFSDGPGHTSGNYTWWSTLSVYGWNDDGSPTLLQTIGYGFSVSHNQVTLYQPVLYSDQNFNYFNGSFFGGNFAPSNVLPPFDPPVGGY